MASARRELAAPQPFSRLIELFADMSRRCRTMSVRVERAVVPSSGTAAAHDVREHRYPLVYSLVMLSGRVPANKGQRVARWVSIDPATLAILFREQFVRQDPAELRRCIRRHAGAAAGAIVRCRTRTARRARWSCRDVRGGVR